MGHFFLKIGFCMGLLNKFRWHVPTKTKLSSPLSAKYFTHWSFFYFNILRIFKHCQILEGTSPNINVLVVVEFQLDPVFLSFVTGGIILKYGSPLKTRKLISWVDDEVN